VQLLQYNTLYVGGRPGTRRFRFDGIIRYLAAQDTVLSHDEISKMHNDMFGITTSTTIGVVNYCTNYSTADQECQLGDSTDFRLVSRVVPNVLYKHKMLPCLLVICNYSNWHCYRTINPFHFTVKAHQDLLFTYHNAL